MDKQKCPFSAERLVRDESKTLSVVSQHLAKDIETLNSKEFKSLGPSAKLNVLYAVFIRKFFHSDFFNEEALGSNVSFYSAVSKWLNSEAERPEIKSLVETYGKLYKKVPYAFTEEQDSEVEDIIADNLSQGIHTFSQHVKALLALVPNPTESQKIKALQAMLEVSQKHLVFAGDEGVVWEFNENGDLVLIDNAQKISFVQGLVRKTKGLFILTMVKTGLNNVLYEEGHLPVSQEFKMRWHRPKTGCPWLQSGVARLFFEAYLEFQIEKRSA